MLASRDGMSHYYEVRQTAFVVCIELKDGCDAYRGVAEDTGDFGEDAETVQAREPNVVANL